MIILCPACREEKLIQWGSSIYECPSCKNMFDVVALDEEEQEDEK